MHQPVNKNFRQFSLLRNLQSQPCEKLISVSLQLQWYYQPLKTIQYGFLS